MNDFYTYAFLREDRTPYYIGKGTGNRIYRTTGRRIKPPKDKSRTIFLKKNLTEAEAFRHEIYMITVFGRKDLGTGILRNETDGGDGHSNPSPETRRKIGEAQKGKIVSEETKRKLSEINKGKTLSEEHIRKLSVANTGEKNHNYGKTRSEETRKKIGESNKNPSKETRRKISEAKKNPSKETRRKIGEAKKGNTYFLGKNHSEETRKKISEARKGKILSEETKRKISEAKKGVKWWNDGCGNCKRMIECPGNDWKPGRK